MGTGHTRREVLTMAGAGLAGLTVAETAAARVRGLGASAPPRGDIQVRRTYADKRFAQEAAIKWQGAAAAGAGAIRLDPGRTFQEVLGFGVSLTDSACYVINQLPGPAREQFLHEMFHPSETGFSVSRICLGSSDYATKQYTYDDGEADPQLARFSIDHDREYILPILLQCRKENPGLFLTGSPWSPPGWMKANNSVLGGSMRKRSFAPYAQYFVRFLQGYEAAGVRVDAICTQNEVDTDQDGRMPACLWGQEYEIEFVSRHLGPQLPKNNLSTKIWILDHNYNLWGRAVCMLEDPGVAKYADGIAWHGYGGQPEMMTRVHDAFPQKHAYFTEVFPSLSDPAYTTDWAKWSTDFADILRNWARCVIGWNLALDENGRPNIGPFPCGGIVTVNSRTKEIVQSGMYWALAHYSRTVKRGARRFESQGSVEGVSHVAFANPDGTSAAILTNTGAERTVRLLLAGRAADVPLPHASVTSLTWQ